MRKAFLLCSLISATACHISRPAPVVKTPTSVPDTEPMELLREIRPFLNGNEILERHIRAMIDNLDVRLFGHTVGRRTFNVESLIQTPRGMAYEACCCAGETNGASCIKDFVKRIRGLACNEKLLRASAAVAQKSARLREATFPIIQSTVALARTMRDIWPQIRGRVDDSQDCDPHSGICTMYKSYQQVFALPAFAPFRTENEFDWTHPDAGGNPTLTGNKVPPYSSQHIAAFLYRRAMQCGPHVLDLYIELGQRVVSAEILKTDRTLVP